MTAHAAIKPQAARAVTAQDQALPSSVSQAQNARAGASPVSPADTTQQ
jgi:hypothetical protein